MPGASVIVGRMPEPYGARARLMGMNRNRWAPLAAVAAVVVAVVAVVAGVSLLSPDGPSEGPPVLRLAAGEAGHAAYGSSMSAKDGASGAYRLVGTLPNGPSEARVRDLPATAAPVDRVRALAAALGEKAEPKPVGGTWTVGDLVVTDQPGNPWTFGVVCGPDTPVSSDGGSIGDQGAPGCAGGTVSSGTATVGPGNPAGGASGGSTGSPGTIEPDTKPGTIPDTLTPEGGTSGGSTESPGTVVDPCPSLPPGTGSIACGEPAPPGGPPPADRVLLTTAQALAATLSVRDALGLADAPTRVEGLSVVVQPLADGVPTEGIATVIQLSAQAGLVSASGSLSIGEEGDTYPLRTARKAFDTLPVVAMGAPCDAAGCPEGPAITGARLGLSHVALEKGAAALLPAWFFTVRGSSVPLVALAVAEKFVSDPSGTGGGTEPGGGGTPEPGTKPGTDPGTGTEPGPDGSVPPSPPRSTPADPSGREPFAFDGAYADPDPKVLVVRYGDSGSCPSEAVRQTVTQEPDRVIVTLTRTAMPPDRACTMDYRAMLVRVTLTDPLGGREVVDGSRKAPVPISTGTPPFG